MIWLKDKLKGIYFNSTTFKQYNLKGYALCNIYISDFFIFFLKKIYIRNLINCCVERKINEKKNI